MKLASVPCAFKMGFIERTLLDQREQNAAAVAENRPSGTRGANAADDARRLLGERMQDWLVTLGSKNIKAVQFDDDFVMSLDGSKFSTTTHHSGSTRTRIVLAFHAALLDVALARGGNHPGWLLFDAPRQHELSQDDFEAYMQRLKLLAARYPERVQVVFSVADLHTIPDLDDQIWRPAFKVDDISRFLGPV